MIYLVEDDLDIARLVRHHLESGGFSVRSFASGTGVISEAEKQPPTLFLLDIMIPGGDGLELCRRIRQNQALAVVPVIFLTARTSEADRVVGLELGADDYISKPFSPRELVARVKAVLRRFERPLVPSLLKAGDIEVDTGAMTLTVRGKKGADDGDRVSPAGLPGAASGAGVHARPVARCGVARHAVCDATVGRRVCSPNSREN